MIIRHIALAALTLSGFCHHAMAQRLDGRYDIYDFLNGPDGNEPRGDLLAGTDGALYGTASVGGTNSNGTVFKLVPPTGGNKQGTLTTLWQFTGGEDGSFPTAGLVGDPSKALYGTAQFDGAHGYGTVFRLVPDGGTWNEHTLFSFTGGADGGNPASTLLPLPHMLFGTASTGGAGHSGVVFSLTEPEPGDSKWTQAVLWSFTGGADGAAPVAGLIADAAGRLYGTTKAGGPAGVGTVFRLTPPADGGTAWTFDVLWGFTGGADGSSPTGPLTMDAAGTLYGTTLFGGAKGCSQVLWPYYGPHPERTKYAAEAAFIPAGGNGCGVVFALAPPDGGGTPWTQTVLYKFSGSLGTDGGNPSAGLLLASDGSLYGNSTDYSDQWFGSTFHLTPPSGGSGPWTETVTADFNGHTAGFYPRGGIAMTPDGSLYTTTSVGGSTWTHVSVYGFGTVVSVSP